jgi:hypothetical protein
MTSQTSDADIYFHLFCPQLKDDEDEVDVELEPHRINIRLVSHTGSNSSIECRDARKTLMDKLGVVHSSSPFYAICKYPEMTMGFVQSEFTTIFIKTPWKQQVSAIFSNPSIQKIFEDDTISKDLFPRQGNTTKESKKIIPLPLIPYFLWTLPHHVKNVNNIFGICVSLIEKMVNYNSQIPSGTGISFDYAIQFKLNFEKVTRAEFCNVQSIIEYNKVIVANYQRLQNDVMLLKSQMKKICPEKKSGRLTGPKKRKVESQQSSEEQEDEDEEEEESSQSTSNSSEDNSQ